MPAADYPTTSSERDAWVVRRRGPRHPGDPSQPHAFLRETEPDGREGVADVWTLFLTNKECPWRCVMCDLWKATLPESLPPGEIPRQIEAGLGRLGMPPKPSDRGQGGGQRWIKVYNSGSFFDPAAIPVADHPAIALQVRGFDRLIVECHPRLVGDRVMRFLETLRTASHPAPPPRLEVAMGLETVHPETLERLNKRMTVQDFQRAARLLREADIDLRVFLLVRPPFLPASIAAEWLRRGMETAFDAGAGVVSIIPTRLGNGSLEELARAREFEEPRIADLEQGLEFGLGLRRGRVFADLWDLARFSRCPRCLPQRRQRLEAMNLRQQLRPSVECDTCGEGGG